MAKSCGAMQLGAERFSYPSLLDLLQAVVVLVQHRLRLLDVLADLGALAPGQVDQGFDVLYQ